MKKPNPADYGYMFAGQGYDEDYRIDWQFEGGEEAYYNALAHYARYESNKAHLQDLKSKFAQGVDDTEVVGIAFFIESEKVKKTFAQVNIKLLPDFNISLVPIADRDFLHRWLKQGSGAGWSPSFLITSRKPTKYDVPIEELQQGLTHRVLWFDADEATNNFFFEFLELVQLDKEGHFDNLPSIDIVALDKAVQVGKELFDGNAIFIEVKK